MERKDFISLLRQMGTNDKLIDKPGIIEPIYLKLRNKSEKEIKNTKAILILRNGDISFEDVDYFVTKDGEEAKIAHGDIEICVNKYGIQTSKNSGDGSNFYSYMNRRNGIIECVSGNSGAFSRKCYLDNGHCLIEKACGERVNASLFGKSEKHGEEIDRVHLDLKAVIATFDKNAKETIRDYPNTRAYYKLTREHVIYNVRLQNDPLKKMQRTIDRLKIENDNLRKRNERLVKRLNAATQFIEGVKKNPASKLFLKKEINDVDTANSLYR